MPKLLLLEELSDTLTPQPSLECLLRKEETQKETRRSPLEPEDLLQFFETTKVRELPLQAYSFLWLVLSCQK